MSKEHGIEQLESAVRRAAAEIRRLREENATLKAHQRTGASAKAWAVERDELRDRVQGLVDQLEALLEDAPEAP